MIYDQRVTPLLSRSVQWRLHLDPSPASKTMDARLYQVPRMDENPGGHLAYLIDRQVLDMPWPRPVGLDDVYGLMVEACMQVRLPGLD